MSKETDIEFTTKIVTIKKSTCNEISYYFAQTFFDWCKKNKIKVEEPYNTKTERYDRFIIKLDTIDKLFMFSNKYLKVLKLP